MSKSTLGIIALIVWSLFGYISNIIVVAQWDLELTGMFWLRIIGIIVGPLGCVLGFI